MPVYVLECVHVYVCLFTSIVYMCTCDVHKNVYVYIYIDTHRHVCLCIYAHGYVCTCMHARVCSYVSYMYVHTSMHVCSYVWLYVEFFNTNLPSLIGRGPEKQVLTTRCLQNDFVSFFACLLFFAIKDKIGPSVEAS